jgi:putative endonuclease
MTGTGEKGRQGEELALKYLIAKGYRPVERNFRALGGEIDVIVEMDALLIFVEVKYRLRGSSGAGMEAVTQKKQRCIIKAAGEYLMKTDQFTRPMRFDVVEITKDGVIHVENAFSGDWS